MKKILLAALILTAGITAQAQGTYQPTDKDRARWTMSDMMSWRMALGAYRQDHGAYPAATTLEQVRAAVEGKYMAIAPMVDAWGNPYRYEAVPDGYRIISSGADGRIDLQGGAARGRLSSLNEDAVLTHEGGWLQRFWSLE